MFTHVPIPTVDTVCQVGSTYGHLTLRIRGVVLTGAGIWGAGGLCATRQRALDIVRWTREGRYRKGMLRVQTTFTAERDEGFEVPASEVEVIDAR